MIQMKNVKTTIVSGLLGAGLMGVIIFCTAQSTQQRTLPTTSAFWRQMLTNETGTATLAALAAGTNNFPYESLVGGLNQANQFLATDGNTNLVSTLNGGSLTNLTYQYTTNPVPGSGSLTFGKAYFTNLQANTTLAPFTVNNPTSFETLVVVPTNSTGTDHSYTMPAGVVGPPGSGVPSVLWVSNKFSALITVSHYGNLTTNCWIQNFAP